MNALDAGAVRIGARPALAARVIGRVRVVLGATVAAVMGVAPHVLHLGPLAGAALLAGGGGTLLFGAIGFAMAIPTLAKIRRRSGGFRAPAAALVLMATVFSLSTFVLGPAITGRVDSDAKPIPARSVPGGASQTPSSVTGHAAHHH